VVHDYPADVLEVDIDAVDGRPVELITPVLGLVVDAGVEAEILDDVVALLLAAGDTDHTGAPRLGDLAGHGADGSGGTGDDHRLPRLGLSQVEAQIGGDAGVAEDADEGGQRGGQGIGQNGEGDFELRVIGDAVVLPAGEADHHGAQRQVVPAGLDDLADGDAPHDLAQRHLGHVAADVAHPQAIGWVQGEVQRSHQCLAGGQLRDGLFQELEVALGQRSLRTPSKTVDAVRQSHGALPGGR
jgi:hypothetical protein